MVCEEMVCEDGWKMVCDRLCVKDGVGGGGRRRRRRRRRTGYRIKNKNPTQSCGEK